MPGAILTHHAAQLAHGTQLVETGEEHHRLVLLVVDTLEEVLDDVKQRIGSQDIALGLSLDGTPHVGRGIFTIDRRIHALAIEGKETSVLTIEFCGHEHIVVIHDEMNKAVPEHPILGVTLIAVLIDAVTVVLTCALVLEFAREQGDAVNKDAQVEFGKVFLLAAIGCVGGAVVHLPHDAEAVLAIKLVGRTLGAIKHWLELHQFHLDSLDG